MAELYTIVFCEVLVPGKASDIKYVNFQEIAVGVPKVDKKSVIDYLMESYNYPQGTKIIIKDIYVFDKKEDFQKYQ
jgi:hypothetical protein